MIGENHHRADRGVEAQAFDIFGHLLDGAMELLLGLLVQIG
jgi:hypothetical protein